MELVSRGKKDVFFTANPKTSFFHSVYARAAAFTKEIYIAKPRNTPEWGRWVEFEIEHRGDLVKHTYLRIDLPSWLPPSVWSANARGRVTDASGVTFGWCNNIGFQMIEKIQMFQDQVLIQELYGEYLDWRLRQLHGIATSYVLQSSIGSRNETALAIGRGANPQSLRVPIPLLGWQHFGDPGLPTIALRSQRFRLRVLFRRVEDLIVASDRRLRPSPWGRALSVQTQADGPVTSAVALSRDAFPPLEVAFETTQLYVPADVGTWLRSQTIRFPFVSVQSDTFTVEDTQMVAAFMGAPGAFSIPFTLDIHGPANRLLVAFRTEANTLAGARTQLLAPNGGGLVTALRLNIANIDRLRPAPVAVWRDVASYWKNVKSALDLEHPNQLAEIYTLTMGGFDRHRPEGTLSFTRATGTTLYATLAQIPYDTRNVSRQMSALVYTELWGVFEIAGGRGVILFDE